MNYTISHIDMKRISLSKKLITLKINYIKSNNIMFIRVH